VEDRIEGLSIGLDLDQTALERGLTGLKDKLKIVNAEMRANLSAFDRADRSIDRYQTQLNGLNRKLEVQKEIVKQARSQYERMVQEHGEGSREADKAARSYLNEVTALNNLNRNIARTQRELEQLRREQTQSRSSLSKFRSHITSTGKSLTDISSKLMKFGKSMTLYAAAPIAAALGISAKFSAEMKEVQGQIQAMTGVSAKEARKQGKIVGQVWADGFGESIDEVKDAVIKIKQNLQGIDDSELKGVTEKAMTLTKITGADLDESLRGVNSLMVNFKMSANEAFDYMVKGAQRGLNKSHELEDNIAEYGQLWAQNGFSAKEMFSILENGLKTGAYNFDKVNDFVKEFGISLNDGRFSQNIKSFSSETQKLFNQYKAGKATTKDVFNSAINDLKGMKSEQQKLTVASTVWSALGEDNAMKVIESLNNTNHAYDNVTGATKKASKALTNTPINQWKQSWREFQNMLKPTGDKLLNIGSKILPKVTGSLKAFKQMFSGDYAGGASLLKKLGFSDQTIQAFIVGTDKIKSIFNGVLSFIKSQLSILKKFWDENGTMIIQAFQNLMKILSPLIKSVFNNIKNIISGALTIIMGVLKVFGGLFTGNWKKVWEGLKDIFKGAFKVLINALELGFFGKIFKSAKLFIKLFKEGFSKMWKAIKNIFSKPIDWIEGIFKKLPGKMSDGLKKGAGGLKKAALYVGNAMLRGLGKGVNGIGKGINWILDKVHAPKKLRIPKWDVPQYAKGTNNHPGGPAIVGDGGKEELIQLPNGRTFLSPNRDTLIDLPKGSSVLNGNATEKLMSLLPKYKDGTGWLESAWDGLKKVTSKTVDIAKNFWEYASHPSKLVSLAISKFTNIDDLSGTTLGIVKGAISTVKESVTSFIKKYLFADNPGGSGVERWRPYVLRALEMNGLSSSLVDKVLRQIKSESGGNPKAINLWDSNAKAGHPSKGLMQTIDSTFNAYKFPGHNNIWNGFDNLLAALNYAKNRYGSNLSGLGEGHGYKTGGLINKAGLYNLVEDGWPEFVIPTNPSRRTDAMKLLALAGRTITGKNKRPNQLPNVSGNDYGEVIERLEEQILIMQEQLVNSNKAIQLLTAILSKDNTVRIGTKEIYDANKKEKDKRDRTRNIFKGVATT